MASGDSSTSRGSPRIRRNRSRLRLQTKTRSALERSHQRCDWAGGDSTQRRRRSGFLRTRGSLGGVPGTVPRHAGSTPRDPASARSSGAPSLRRRDVRCGDGDSHRAPLGRPRHRSRGITSSSETPGRVHLGPRSRTEAMDHNGLRPRDRSSGDESLRVARFRHRGVGRPYSAALRDTARLHGRIPGSILAASCDVPRPGGPSGQFHLRVSGTGARRARYRKTQERSPDRYVANHVCRAVGIGTGGLRPSDIDRRLRPPWRLKMSVRRARPSSAAAGLTSHQAVTPSMASRARLSFKPPPYPPIPLLASTRWHGTMIGIGLRPLAWPTARGALGRPTRRASSP